MNKLFDICITEKQGALAFSTDAFLLFAFLPVRPGLRGCELGTGNGSIALLAASRGKLSHIDAVELQQSLAEAARNNIENNHMSDNVTLRECDLRLLTAELNGTFDTVFFNPPYMRNDCTHTSSNPIDNACRREVNGDICDFCGTSSRLLKNGGSAYAVYRPDRLTDILCAMRESGTEPKELITVHPAVGEKPCLILLKAVKNASPSLSVREPLYIYADNRVYSEKMKAIYESGIL